MTSNIHPTQQCWNCIDEFVSLQREVRAHFNCPSLIGAELENQGGQGAARVHWEKRIFGVREKDMEALKEFSRHVSSPCASVNTPQLGIHYQMFLPICTEFPPSCPLGRTDVCISRGNTCDIQDHPSSAGRLGVCVVACFLFDQMPTLCTLAAWPVLHQCNISVNATLKHCAYTHNNGALRLCKHVWIVN